MVIGFVTTGSNPQRLLVRAAGPALSGLGISGYLTDPMLSVYAAGGRLLSENDNWTSDTTALASSVGAFAFASDSRDSALAAEFPPGPYTIKVGGRDSGSGIAVVEAYDLSGGDDRVRLANLSTRGLVGFAGENLTAGLVVTGTTPRKLLIRAVGPGLLSFGVLNALPDCLVSVFTGTGTKVFENDDWESEENAADIIAAASRAGAFNLQRGSKDAALLAYLPPGSYSFVVSAKGSTQGIALLEAYDVD